MGRKHASLALVACVGLLGAGCERAGEAEGSGAAAVVAATGAESAGAESAGAESAGVVAPTVELEMLGEAGRGSAIVVGVLARPPASVVDRYGRVVIVADEEGDAVRVLDATSGKAVSETAVSGGPTQVLAASGGRVLVALRRESAVAVMAMSEDLGLVEVARARTAEEPVALAFAEEHVLVVSGFGHALEGFTADGLEKAFSVDLPREPRSVVVTGGHAFVSHMVGSTVSDIDLRVEPPQRAGISLAGTDIASFCGCMCSFSFIARAAVQGFAVAEADGRLVLPLAFSRSGPPEAAGGYGGASLSFPNADAALLSIDIESKRLTYRVEDTVFTNTKLRERADSFASPPARTSPGRCLLPRAVATVRSSQRLLVACMGSDEVVEIESADKAFVSSFSRAYRVPSGPVAIAVDEARGEAFVWSTFDRAVSVLALGDANGWAAQSTPSANRPSAKGASSASGASGTSGAAGATVRGGAQKTGTAGRGRTFALARLPGEDARAALGRKLFHATFDGRISLDGRACASCHPDGRDDGLVWSSPKGPLQTPMLAGRLAETAPYGWVGDARTVGDHLHDTLGRLGGKGLGAAEKEALVAYVMGLAGPARQAAPGDALVSRGKEIFESVDTMCTICHTQSGAGTDGTRHDVGSGLSLETPTLRFVAGTAPYFHDGRYATLRDLLKGSSGKMGGSLDGLGDGDMDALEAYLRTL